MPVRRPIESEACWVADEVADPATWVVRLSADQRRASEKRSAPTGMIMNSWKSTLESACAPPFSTFSMGVGRTLALTPPR